MAVTTITTLRKMKLTAGAVSIVPSISSSVYCHTVSPNMMSYHTTLQMEKTETAIPFLIQVIGVLLYSRAAWAQ